MRKMAMAILAGGLLVGAAAASPAAVLVSDTFDRADDATGIGTTEQGYAWGYRQVYDGGGPANYAPGIKDNQMFWQGYSGGPSKVVFVEDESVGKLKNFRMEFDLIRISAPSAHGFEVNFRSYAMGQKVSDAGTNDGYRVTIYANSDTEQVVQFDTEYSNPAITQTVAAGLTSHVTIQAEENNFKVWLDDQLAVDFTDTSANPGANAAGWYSLHANLWRHFAVDNFVVSDLQAIPEPATMTLLGLGGLAALRRRRSA